MQRRIRKPSLKVKENEEVEKEKLRLKADTRAQVEARKQEKTLARQKRAEEEKAKRMAHIDDRRQAKSESQQKKTKEDKARAVALQRQSQTPEERLERLQKDSRHHSNKLQAETDEKRQERLQSLSQSQAARLQAETAEKRQERLQRVSLSQAARLQAETANEKDRRLLQETLAKKRKRDLRAPEEIDVQQLQEREAKRQHRIKKASAPQSIKDASHKFLSTVREGPDYVCTCCHRLMYRKTVVEFKLIKYSKVSGELLSLVLPPEIASGTCSVQQKVWICKTCDINLKRGKMPAQATANNLGLEHVPAVLSDLNPMEVRLVSLRIPFMKMVALPCGRQRAIHGPAVNVPTDLHPVCDLLPRLPSQTQIVPMKLKRKLCYKGHYMYEYVRPAKVMAALEWLKANNPLYSNIQINSNWQEHSAHDDTELWQAISTQCCPLPSQGVTSASNFVQSATTTTTTTENLQARAAVQQSSVQDIDHDFAALASLARERHFALRDVPRDGNCLFTSVLLQLQRVGGPDTLRQQLVAYFEDHPYVHDGTAHLREFIAAPFRSSDSRNADTEMPNEVDQFVDSIQDDTTRLQVRWCRYLERLGSTAWGDHVAVQGLADMLCVDIHILSTINPNMEPIKACNTAVRVVYLGLVGQFHYMALEKISDSRLTPQVSNEAHPSSSEDDVALQVQSSQEDSDRLEDEEAFNRQTQLRGLPYASLLQREDVDVSADNVFSVAPSEGQKPIPILTDEHFEEMCNPTKYPFGKFGFMANREKKLTVRKYFNQRLLHADGRFAKDVEYLLTAQYAVESKQVVDDASIMLRQSRGRLYQGRVLTAGAIQNEHVLQQMLQRDDAYRFLKNVRGSPAYFQRVMYDVLAMIRQLGLPTWFLTQSAADMQWPDVIQAVARQYGTTFTDEDVAAMSFEEKSKWLRQNPVTAARHFQYRLNTFFQDFLKSKACPLGELTDYSIRIEFQARGSPHAHTMLWIKDAPKLGVDSDEDVCAFIDRYVHCNIPADETLAELVCKLQKHRHSATCRRNGRCRFHYPRPPSSATVIARQLKPDDMSAEEAEQAKAALLAVRKILDDKDTPDDISLDDLLDKAGVSQATYMKGLKICSKGNCVVMSRKPCESWINAYNLDVLSVWRANMDLQYILDPYACVMYITSYMLKSEKANG